MSASRIDVAGVSSAGLNTTQLPATIAGALFQTGIAHGKFHGAIRSEEHTSELQSRLHLVCRLLLEKKKKNNKHIPYRVHHSHHARSTHAHVTVPESRLRA